jgi:hypothetical protein
MFPHGNLNNEMVNNTVHGEYFTNKQVYGDDLVEPGYFVILFAQQEVTLLTLVKYVHNTVKIRP